MPTSRTRIDIPDPGEVVRTVVDGQPVAVWNVAGEIHAIGDICPHRGFVLSEGNVYLNREGCASVVCPGHHWRFDLVSGEAAFRPECVPVYGVEIDGDNLWISALPGSSPGSRAEGAG